jgi:hypothetical protein
MGSDEREGDPGTATITGRDGRGTSLVEELYHGNAPVCGRRKANADLDCGSASVPLG